MTDSDPSEPIQISLGEMRFVPAPQELPPEPPAPAPPAPKKPNKSIPWKKIDDALVAVRTATLNGLLLVSVIAVVGLMATDLNRDVVVIDPIRLPEPLRKMGFSEDVAAHRLWDEVLRINEGTPTAKDRVAVLPASQRVDFEAPGAGISLQALVQMMRRFLGLEETRIAGEFICTTTDCKPESLALRLRVFRRGGMKVISMPVVGDQTGKTGIDRYFGDAARELLRELDPYVVAFHLYQTDKAAAEREALQIIGPGDAQRKWALNLLGLIAAHRGDHETAIGWYERAIAADAGNPFAIAYINWGETLRAQGDLDAAIAKFIHAIELDPEYVLAYNNWGNALSDQGDLDGAISKFAQAIEIDPEDVLAYYNWGVALYTKGDLDGAIAKYRQATELDPTEPDAFYNWGVALNDMGDLDGAIVQYMRAIELNPEDAAAHNNWGNALKAKGDLDGAIVQYMRATELDPGNAVGYNNWGNALKAKGDRDGAIVQYKRAIELDPGYAVAYGNWGSALEAIGDLGGAITKYKHAIDLDPGYAAAYYNWGNALYQSGDPDGAVTKYKHAIDLDPEYANAFFNMALVQENAGRAADAAIAFQRYLDLRPDVYNASQLRDHIAALKAAAE
jgi:tetratricopeptide (TPR) repeat protein